MKLSNKEYQQKMKQLIEPKTGAMDDSFDANDATKLYKEGFKKTTEENNRITYRNIKFQIQEVCKMGYSSMVINTSRKFDHKTVFGKLKDEGFQICYYSFPFFFLRKTEWVFRINWGKDIGNRGFGRDIDNRTYHV